MSLGRWQQNGRELIADMHIFTLSRLHATNPRTGVEREIALVETRDWVNVIALTPDRDVVLVEQYRHGIDAVTLEIPGGLVDPGESALDAAVRELREETGYTGSGATVLGVVEPNPAFLDNRCSTILVENCERTHVLELDDGEDIEVSTMALADIPSQIAGGRIAHALVVCGFWWLALRRPDLFPIA